MDSSVKRFRGLSLVAISVAIIVLQNGCGTIEGLSDSKSAAKIIAGSSNLLDKLGSGAGVVTSGYSVIADIRSGQKMNAGFDTSAVSMGGVALVIISLESR